MKTTIKIPIPIRRLYIFTDVPRLFLKVAIFSNREPFEIKYSKNYVQEKSSTVSRDSFSPEIEKQIQETLAAGYILSVNPEGEVYIHIDGRPLFEGVSRENSDTSAVTTQNELKIEMSNSETNNQSIDDKL